MVNFDWLEDSLLSPHQRPKDTRPYEWDRLAWKKKEKEQAQKSERTETVQKKRKSAVFCYNAFGIDSHLVTEFTAQITEFQKLTGQCMHSLSYSPIRPTNQIDLSVAAGYRIYTDATNFSYAITLVRSDILKNLNETHRLKVRYTSHLSATRRCPTPLYNYPRTGPLSFCPCILLSLPPELKYRPTNPYLRVPIPMPWAQTLQIFESDALPHRYMCISKFTTRGKAGTAHLTPIGSQYDITMAAFKKFFKLKTGIAWEARLESSKERKNSACEVGDGGFDGSHLFKYMQPAAEEPQGAMRQKTRKEELKENKNKPEATVLLPYVELSKAELDVSARTPEAGW